MFSKPRILIVEDEPGIADTLLYVLAADGFAPHWCASGEAALAAFAAELPALAILDVGLPDLNGFALFRRLQALPGGAQVPMLFLTARSEEIDRVVGLELGADDYIAKPFSPRELVARVRSVLRRSARGAGSPDSPDSPDSLGPAPRAAEAAPLPAPGTASPPFGVDDARRQIRYYGQLLELARYEYGLLRLLVRHPGRVYARSELLEQVWDDAGEPFDRTVDAHIKTLRAKLKAIAPGIEPIRTLRGTGYALAEDWPAAAGSAGATTDGVR